METEVLTLQPISELCRRLREIAESAFPHSLVLQKNSIYGVAADEIERLKVAVNEAASMGLGSEWLDKWLKPAGESQTLREIERLRAEVEWWCCEFKLAAGPEAWNTAVNRHADWATRAADSATESRESQSDDGR